MYFVIFMVLMLTSCSYCQMLPDLRNSHDFGPYNVVCKSSEVCKGPKSLNATFISASVRKESEDKYLSLINITYFTRVAAEETKIAVFRGNKTTNSILWSYKFKNICQHPIFSIVIKASYDVDNNCSFKKGSYYTEYNMTDITKGILGNSFFYGDFLFKITSTSKKFNIACLTFSLSFIKIP